MVLTGIKSEHLQEWWPQAWPLLRPAVERGGHMTAESVYKGLRECDLQLWVATDSDAMKAACVTEISQWPATRECTVVLCGGQDSSGWLHLLATIEAWAKAADCRRMMIDGRAGWIRKLPDYRKVSVVLSKELH